MAKFKYTIIPALALLLGGTQSLAAAERPVVLELFTSQGCSSCPAADALLKTLAVESSVLVLSYHVHYWDYLGWKDPFSSSENTDRQRQYAQAMGRSGVFTPELIVDGVRSVVGSDQGAVSDAIHAANQQKPDVTMALTAKGKVLNVHISAAHLQAVPADVIAVRFQRNSTTDVKAGENIGRTLTSMNHVIETKKLGVWNNTDNDYQMALNDTPGEGIAILLQSSGQGRIVGAQEYRGGYGQ